MDDIAGGDDIEAESAHAEDASTVAEKDEEDSLPKPSTRRTRQRTRELSVMSDSSVQMDDTMTSLRRSTRIKNKPADDVTSPKRERKSAKSPPPTTGKRSKRKEPVSEATSDADMQAGRLSRAVSPRRARSPQKASAVGGRASSPAVEDQNMTIEQVISPAQPVEASAKEQSNQGRLSAREQRLQSTLGRRTRGFSAKDEADDIAPSSFGHTEQPKLKLPNSVFANRFSFGRSPSSSVLASPSSSTTNTGAVPTNGAKPLSAQASNEVEPVLPKFALPSSITPASLNVTFPHASEPGVNSHTLVKPTSAQSVASTPSFPAVATPDALQTAASTNKPLFSFTAPTKAPAEPSQTLPPKSHDQGIQASKPSPVSLIGSSQTISTTDEASNATTISAPFTFGQASNKRKVSRHRYLIAKLVADC